MLYLRWDSVTRTLITCSKGEANIYLETVQAAVVAHDQLLMVLQRVDVTISYQHGAKGLSLWNKGRKERK